MKFEIFVYILVAIATIVLFIAWSERQSERIMEASYIYEKCIIEEYGRGPAEWYMQFNEYPECPKNLSTGQ